MELQLAGEVAVVIGAARGIGLAIASAFIAEGASVALVDCDASVLKQAESLRCRAGDRTLGMVADVTSYTAVRSAVTAILGAFGRFDHVVHAAAVGSGKFGFPFWNLEPEDWKRVWDVNVMGAVNTAHAFTAHLIERRRGTLLFLASVAGQIGSQTDPPYSASKAAIINFTMCAAKDLAPYGVRVNALCPGMVKTALNQSVWDAWNREQPIESQLSYEDWTAEKIQRLVPLGRWQSPDDVAAMAIFLASSKAKNITGQTINVDGGYVMHW